MSVGNGRQHLQSGETPKEMYDRIVSTLTDVFETMSDRRVDKSFIERLKASWSKYLWNGWLCPSTPILANCGTNKGHTISCFISRVPDSVDGIYKKVHEMAMLTKSGGGVGITFDKVRGRGEVISSGGFTEGVVPFIKVFDSAILATSQGSIRRGAISINLPIRHKDIKEFLKIREPIGDVNRQCLNINHCVTIDDYFYQAVLDGDTISREIWTDILSSRMKTGQPYIFNYHNVNNNKSIDWKRRGLKIDGTNLCSEIIGFHDSDHTVVCDLASLNLSKYDEWANEPDFVENCLLFLDSNLELFIKNAEGGLGMESAVNFAKKSRMLGLGVLGWHTFLQSKDLPFNSIASTAWIRRIMNKIKASGDAYNEKWGAILGAPEWCDSNRNISLFAIAPTTSNSLVAGGVSQGIEPIVCNAFVQKSAKGTFIRKNKKFQILMETKYPQFNTDAIWDSIMYAYKGSVQHLEFLTDEEKEIYLTAYEINQLELIKNAAVWQQYIASVLN